MSKNGNDWMRLLGASLLALGTAGTLACTPAPAAAGAMAPADAKAAQSQPQGEDVPLDKLPKAVTAAVKKALPGAVISKATKLEDGNYFLDDVKVGKKEYDVTVSPEGKVLKTEEQKDSD